MPLGQNIVDAIKKLLDPTYEPPTVPRYNEIDGMIPIVIAEPIHNFPKVIVREDKDLVYLESEDAKWTLTFSVRYPRFDRMDSLMVSHIMASAYNNIIEKVNQGKPNA